MKFRVKPQALFLSFFKFLIPVIFGILIFFLSMHYFANDSKFAEYGDPGNTPSYVVLALDESQNDRLVQETLKEGGVEHVISESTQSVYIDDFGSLKTIPLESFHNEIEDYDPRNDGYASKLSEFFVHDGKRFFFIPMKGNLNELKVNDLQIKDLQKRLEDNLKDIPFQLMFSVKQKPAALYFLLLAIAGIASLFLSRGRRLFLFQLPLLVAAGWAGKTAIFLAAILTGVWELLREPLREFFAADIRKRKSYSGSGFKGAMKRLIPYRLNLLLAFIFIILLPVFSMVGLFPLLLLSSVCVSFFLLIVLSFKFETLRSRSLSHVPFTPVLLLPLKARTFFLFPFLLPFGLASVLALFLFPALPAKSQSPPMDSRYFISPEDYYRHLDFQRTFSYKSLNRPLNGPLSMADNGGEALNQNGYLRYYLGEDGLISGSSDSGISRGKGPLNPDTGLSGEPPSFPLEKLMDFLIGYHVEAGETETGNEPANPPTVIEDWIPVVIILAFCALDLLRPGIANGKKFPVFRDKRAAA